MKGKRIESGAAEVRRAIAFLTVPLSSSLSLYHVRAYGSAYEGRLHGPPARPGLVRFLERNGDRFPPSYKAFLARHNGWTGYRAGFTLIGVSGRDTAAARRDIRETLEVFEDGWEAQYGPPTAERVAAVEATSPDEAAYLPYFTPFGTDFNGALLLFEPRRRRKNGEMEVLLYDSSGPSRRYRGFIEMLRVDLKELRKELRNLETKN